MTTASKHLGGSSSRWWETSGSLRTALVQLDGQLVAVVNAEKRVVDPAVVSVKSGFTREVGSIRRQVPSRGLRDPGE